MTTDIEKLFDQTRPWRDRLGEPRLRIFPEIILAVLAAAIEDAESVEAEGSTSSREQLNEEAGEDLYALCRQLGEAIITNGAFDPPHDSLSERITAALGTPDWVIVSSSKPLGSELIAGTDLDAYADATPRAVETAPESITVPRPHVAYGPEHVTAEEADSDYLRAAVKNIDYLARGERLWGSNLTATIRKLLLDAADAVEALPLNAKERKASVRRCPKCGHAPHDRVCFNMASDNDCDCVHESLRLRKDGK